MMDGYLYLYDVVQPDDNQRGFNPSYFVVEFKEASVIIKDTIISHFKKEVSFEDLKKCYKKVRR